MTEATKAKFQNDENPYIKAKHDEEMLVVLGTLIENLEDGTPELYEKVKQAGGILLFDEEWACEVWRRIDAAMSDGKGPNAYKFLKQVCTLPPDLWELLTRSSCTVLVAEEQYLPGLTVSAVRRRQKRAMLEGSNSGDVAAAMSECAEAQKLIDTPHEKSVAEMCNEIIDGWNLAHGNQGKLTGITSGLRDLDDNTWGFQKQDFVIIGARPSQGKTAMTLGFFRAAAVENKIPTLFITLETSSVALLRRLACQVARANQKHLRSGTGTERDMTSLPTAFSKINAAPIKFYEAAGHSISTIQLAVKRMTKSYGFKLIIVDYLQAIVADRPNEKRTYEVAQVSRGLKKLAIDLDIPVIAAAQLNREPEKQSGRAPRLSDLADCAQIERDADIIGLLHKDKDGQHLIIAKNRDGETGMIDLTYLPQFTRFEDTVKIADADIQNKPYAD